MQRTFPPHATRAFSDEEKARIHMVPLQKLFTQLESSEQGLTGSEASQRLDKYGPNDMTGLKHTSSVIQFLRLFLNPLIAILLVASVVSAIPGDPVDASIIVVIVLLSNILNFVQTSRSQNSVEKLRADVAPTCQRRKVQAMTAMPPRVLPILAIASFLGPSSSAAWGALSSLQRGATLPLAISPYDWQAAHPRPRLSVASRALAC